MDGLTEREAFDAMSLFVRQFADRAGDDLLTLLGDIEILESDNMPTDRAAWQDWLECVAEVKRRRSPEH